MNISKIYEKYEIPPNLADHQLTVAGVASVICEKTGKGSKDEVVAACLLHDMGNIIKFNLDKKIPGVEMENIEHWKAVKERFIEKYGNEEHLATMAIIEDIRASEQIKEMVDAVGFHHSIETLKSNNISKMIAAYSDMRVAPHGVVPLEVRLSDLSKRYGASDDREQYNETFRKIETAIFSDQNVGPDIVNQETVDIQKKRRVTFEI